MPNGSRLSQSVGPVVNSSGADQRPSLSALKSTVSVVRKETFQRPCNCLRAQKTQMRPVPAGSKSAAGSRSASGPGVSVLAVPHVEVATSQRLYQICHPPPRRELQNNQTPPTSSTNAVGSVSSGAGLTCGVGRRAPKPSAGAAVEASTSISTSELLPVMGETSSMCSSPASLTTLTK